MSAFKKVMAILSREQRRTSVLILVFMIIGMLLETLSIGLVIPALALLTQNDLALKYPSLATLLIKLGNPSHARLIIYGMSILVCVYLVKTLYLSILTWRQMKFAYEVQAHLSQRLFMCYLRQPYSSYLNRNSAEMINNVVSETHLFMLFGLMAGMTVITELFVIVGIFTLLLVAEPLGAMFLVIMFGFVVWCFHRVTKDRILHWGEARQRHEALRIQYLQEGLGAFKDVKLFGREYDFLANYSIHNIGNARIGQRQQTMVQLPRLWIELIAIFGLAALVQVMIFQGTPLVDLLPTLGLFAAAAFRIMPSVNRTIGALQNLRFSLPVIDSLFVEINNIDSINTNGNYKLLSFENALRINHISFKYPLAESAALEDISLVIQRGSSVGIIGGSGAGKSTLVDIILGLLTPLSGNVTVDGVDMQTNLRGWQDQIGYVPQNIFLADDTLLRNVAFGLANENINEDEVMRAIRAAQLEQFVGELPLGLDTIIGERGARLSGGQRQRIGIARALYHNPPVLVLDEATSSLDVSTEKNVMDAVRALCGDKTKIIIAHRLSTVEHCDRLFRLEKGKLVEYGNASEILKKKCS
jgi:ABC-type multidrug transport system fused ATPase/permease subunit